MCHQAQSKCLWWAPTGGVFRSQRRLPPCFMNRTTGRRAKTIQHMLAVLKRHRKALSACGKSECFLDQLSTPAATSPCNPQSLPELRCRCTCLQLHHTMPGLWALLIWTLTHGLSPLMDLLVVTELCLTLITLTTPDAGSARPQTCLITTRFLEDPNLGRTWLPALSSAPLTLLGHQGAGLWLGRSLLCRLWDPISSQLTFPQAQAQTVIFKQLDFDRNKTFKAEASRSALQTRPQCR